MILRNAWRRSNIGRRMNEAVRIFENRIIENLKAKGHSELTAAHINLTRNLDEDGTRLTELARRASLTKQSMSELVDQVERTGLIEKRQDPADGRAKLVCFTDSGFVWLEAFHQSLEVAEGEMRDQLGPAMVDLMVEALGKYVECQINKESDQVD
ncbi:DNA-binding MarR family transcriptional regulator [Rhizobium leguminosarum]|uniref:DNA-binding MarR family transcriptional regulator n=3 Tax=Rhizobium TaxID=379 RepID=A0A7W6XYE3_9HYPH|nr:Transcriptional regulator, MarR family [Rhizobium leguminosarum]MBB4443438.1 DNA-binding MarR family transcriptional regulator [Rhizobium esperanzae]MDH6202902.1 DNA-binding MarR family transcriptional regulator [Rhizobium leguminosarum]